MDLGISGEFFELLLQLLRQARRALFSRMNNKIGDLGIERVALLV
jgi:hypothetical protein